MPYSEPENVRRLVDTTLTDADIVALIAESDAEIDRRVGPRVTGDPLARKLSALITARTILGRDPSTVSVGEYSETRSLDDLTAEIGAILRGYTRPSIVATTQTLVGDRGCTP